MARKMRRLGGWVAEFVSQWKEAAEANLTLTEFAELVGVSYESACRRACRLRSRGLYLPAFRRPSRKAGKPKSAQAWLPTHSQAQFIKAYRHAVAHGLPFDYVCDRLGITRGAAAVRKSLLKKRGITLPPLRCRSKQRVAAKPALVAPAIEVVPVVHSTFTITVGG